MPSAKQQPSNVKHGGAIRPNVWVLTFGPPLRPLIETDWSGCKPINHYQKSFKRFILDQNILFYC